MRPRVLAFVALSAALTSGPLAAAELADLLPSIEQLPPVTAPTPPPTPPATRPTTPPSPIPPGLASPPTLAPVTNTAGTAPQSLASSGAGFTPYMMGDLPSSSFIQGQVCFPGQVTTFVPPVTVTIPAHRVIVGDGQVVIVPAQTIVVRPAQTIVQPGTVCRNILIPQVGRGDIKIEENESPRPVDRVYVTYNYFNDVTHAFPGVPASDLHRETYGFELTFLDGNASVGLRMNSLQTTGDSTFAGGDFGDLTAIFKYALINDRATGNVLSVGLAVTAPTGPDAILLDGSRINPTYLQPFAGFIYNWDQFYTQNFTSVIVPTDSRDVLLGTSSLGVGYWLYRATDPTALVTYVTPVVEGHVTVPFNHRGLDNSTAAIVGFPDTLVLTNGLHVGLGAHSNLALGVAVPLTGPKIFNVEGIAQLNWRF